MKKLIIVVLLSFIASVNAIEQSSVSSSVENDYIWQERFKNVMSKAENGVASSQYSVGEMFEKGRGTQKDVKQAFSWYEKAANQRHIKAQFKVGYLYYKGLGVKRSSDKAFKNFKKPADEGNVRAQYYLGKLYQYGQGVDRDEEQALIWFSRASTGGFRPAEDALEEFKRVLAKEEEKEEDSEKDRQKAVAEKAGKSSTKETEKIATATPKKKASKQAEAKKVKATKLNAISNKILDGGWAKRKKAAEFLPSTITQCKKTSSSIMECLSGKLKRNIGVADITYITKAILFEIKESGEFKVAYRNNILEIETHIKAAAAADEEGENKALEVTVKKGWQETEHQLECKIENKESIACVKNKVRKLKFKSELKT